MPDLPAKPIIDILVAVQDAADEATYLADLEAAGFVLLYREPHLGEHRLLRRRDQNVHAHVFTVGTLEMERMLLFRDRLRAVPGERELYARTKRELANRPWGSMRDYANAKSPVVEEIIARARAGLARSTMGGRQDAPSRARTDQIGPTTSHPV